MPNPLSIFISYSHADEPDKDRLLSELGVLASKGLITVWDDRQLYGGEAYSREIIQAMDKCHLALLLVSRHFLASKFIQTVEQGHLLARRENDGIRVVPVILSYCQWTEVEAIGALQTLTKDAKPIQSFPEDLGQRDQAWMDIGKQIGKWALEFLEGQSTFATEQTLPAPAASASLAAPVGAVIPVLPIIPPVPQSAIPAFVPTSTTAPGPSPYDPWQPALPPRFFGRDDELQFLHQAMDEGRSVSIIGERRIGKTSLLKTWQSKLQALHRKAFYLSGLGPEAATCSDLVAAVMRPEPVQAGQPATNGPQTPEQMADWAANRLASWCKTQAPLPPVLLIDEADPLPQRLPHRFFERLRNLVENRQLCLVFASHEDVNEVYQKTGRTSPLINLLETRQLGLLSTDAASMMIAQGQFDAHNQALLHKMAGTHPYYLALLGRRLWEVADNGQALAQFHYEAEKRLAELWAHLSAAEKTALEQIGKGMAVANHRRVERLKMKGFLDVKGQLFGEVLADWLRDRE